MTVNLVDLNNIYNKLNNIDTQQKAFKARLVNIAKATDRLTSTNNNKNRRIKTKLAMRNIDNNSKNYNKITNAIKQANSASYLTNLQNKLTAGSLGKYSKSQMQNLERAILDKKFALSNSKSFATKTVKYNFHTANKMNAQELKNLAIKLSKTDATKLYKDLRNGAYNTNLTKKEINQISFKILEFHKLF